MIKTDFTRTYEDMTDAKLEQTISSIADLVPEAQEALKAEAGKRKIFDRVTAATTPKARAYTSKSGVVVNAAGVYFPPFCPRCMSPNPTQYLSYSAARGAYQYRIFYSKYRVKSFQIAFCKACASKIRRVRALHWMATVATLVLARFFVSSQVGAFLLFMVFAACGLFLFHVTGFSYDQTVHISSSADDPFSSFVLDNPTYQKLFLQANAESTHLTSFP